MVATNLLPLPAPGGRLTGIIYPSGDQKAIIDKTAQFVAKTGPALEGKILEKEKANPNFAFLKPLDPYHPYYRFKLNEFKLEFQPPGSSDATKVVAPSISAAPEITKEPKAPRVISALAKVKKPAAPIAPPAPEFIIGMPQLTAQELDIMRLTAQFVARNGPQFHQGLLHREFKNPQFEFLKPTNPFYIYFTALVDSYVNVFLPPRNIADKFKSLELRDKNVVLEKAYAYMEYEVAQDIAKKKADEEQENERNAMSMIDWHDFVIVETIEFFDDEADLPAPATAEQLETQIEDEEMDMEDDTSAEVGVAPRPAGAAPAPPPTESAKPPPPPEEPLPPPPTNLRILKEPIKPKVQAQVGFTVLCPRCNQQIPQNEYNEHMRIELLDPRYSKMKAAADLRRKEAMMAPDDISQNLRYLAEKRTDIFGTADEEVGIGKSVDDTQDKPEKVTWDGHSGSIGQTTSAAQANVSSTATIVKGPEAPSIGPAVPERLQNAPSNQHIPIQPPRTTPIITVVPGAVPGAPIAAPPSAIVRPPMPGLGMPGMGLHGMPPMPPGLVPGMMPGMVPGMVPGMMPGMIPGMMPGMMPGMPGMPHMYMPMAPGIAPPGMAGAPIGAPPPENEPEAKRQKTDEANLIPEELFLSQNPGPINIVVQVPSDAEKAEWSFTGQNLNITLNPTDTIQVLKDRIKDALSMPQNKQKLKAPGISILKDTNSLAFYNVKSGTVVSLGVKERGGRKK